MPEAFAHEPAFDRLNYYYGQLLGAGDFLAEQRYFREKLKLHNRCLHGAGVVCGLGVVIPTVTPPATTAALQVNPGLALDPEGNELLVRHPIAIPDVLALLSAADRASLPTSGTGVSLWISIAYQERGIEPNRPVLPDACAASPACLFGKTREQVCVQATLTAPVSTGSTCCAPPASSAIVLARIDGVLSTTTAITAANLHTEVSQSLNAATTITGVTWTHGGSYSAANAGTLLGNLAFQFSAPVYSTETSPQATVDVWRIAASGGAITSIAGKLTWTAAASPAPAGTATAVAFQASAPPALASGDRILVTLRAATILDTSCRPLAGANAGGRLPVLSTGIADLSLAAPNGCASSPTGGAWTTAAGGDFGSWFFVR